MPARKSAKSPRSTSTDDRGTHGGLRLRGVRVDTYNLTVRDESGEAFVGDQASETGFFEILDRLRRRERTGKDALGPEHGPKTDKSALERALHGGDVDSAHLVHLAVEEYAQCMAALVRFYLAQPGWEGVARIVMGGGFPDKSFGGLAMRRTQRLLKNQRVPVELQVLTQDPDEGALIGWVHALPAAMLRGHDAFLAVDIGGTHVRCGIVEHAMRRAADGSRAKVSERMQWRHGDDEPTREELVRRIAAMLNALAAQARTLDMRLAPVVGIACPGQVDEAGGLPQGTQNLPGEWEPPFNLPRELGAMLDPIAGDAPAVLMHNDAVVQGLGDAHRMKDVERWAVLTIGTGLGNAAYTNL